MSTNFSDLLFPDPISGKKSLTDAIIDDAILPPPFERKVEKITPYGPGKVTNDIQGKLLKKFIKYKGITDFHIKPYDEWVSNYLPKYVYSQLIELHNNYFLGFENLKIVPPRKDNGKNKVRLYPDEARLNDLSYQLEVYATAYKVQIDPETGQEIEETKIQTDSTKPLLIAKIPLMLGSKYCYLSSMSDKEKEDVGEDYLDPLGYFVMGGNEKIVLLNEKLRFNQVQMIEAKGEVYIRMIVFSDTTSTVYHRIAMNTSDEILYQIKSIPKENKVNYRTKSGSEKKNDLIKKEESTGMINVGYIFKYLYPEENTVDLMLKTVLMCTREEWKAKVQDNLLRTIIGTASISMEKSEYMEQIASILEISKEDDKEQKIIDHLDKTIFPHIIDVSDPSKARKKKLYMLASMVARLCEFKAGYRKSDNRDSWSFKQLFTAGNRMQSKFRTWWRKTLSVIKKKANDVKYIQNGYPLSNLEKMDLSKEVTKGFYHVFSIDNWGSHSNTAHGASQTVERTSFAAFLSHMTRIMVDTKPNRKQVPIRKVQLSQIFIVDPVETPSGQNCGVIKNLAITATLSPREPTDEVIRILEDEKYAILEKTDPTKTTIVTINGIFIGWCDGALTKSFCEKEKRGGRFPRNMAVVLTTLGYLYLYTTESRPMAPLVVVPENQNLDKKELLGKPFSQLFDEGKVEYIDPHAMEYAVVAVTPEDVIHKKDTVKRHIVENRLHTAEYEKYLAMSDGGDEEIIKITNEKKEQMLATKNILNRLFHDQNYTHCMIDPHAMLGFVSSLIPFSERNPGPKNTAQSSMFKQAPGIYHSNHLNRFDTENRVLAWPAPPLFSTQMNDIVGLDERPQGVNVILAIATWNGWTQEDAFVFNQASIDNGKFDMMKYWTFREVIASTAGNVTEKLMKPEISSDVDAKHFRFMNQNGLPTIGAYYGPGDRIIGKVISIADGNKVRDLSKEMPQGEEGYVEAINVSKRDGNIVVKVKMKIRRIPIRGDKFAPRYAQKGTIGMIVPSVDMPYTASGVRPDIIINPQTTPSRMTMGYLIEILAGKYSALTGERVDATPFRLFDPASLRHVLSNYGYNPTGYETMYSGITGEKMKGQIFIGVTHFQILKHQVSDKHAARGKTGQRETVTRQPVKGRSRGGGKRFGHMETDTLIAHGASGIVRSQLCELSDAHELVECKTCGQFASVDSNYIEYNCNTCNDKTQLGKRSVPFASIVMTRYLQGMGMNPMNILKEKKIL
jgi:DNA-directed RNA polymerase II subunit RPB2